MIKKVLILMIAIFMAGNLFSQTVFSFSGLNWGDNITVVESKLNAINSKFSFGVEKYACKVMEKCTVWFDGKIMGRVDLEDNKLVSVWVRVIEEEHEQILEKLKVKYGKPLEKLRTQGLGKGIVVEEWFWRSPNHETLILNCCGIEYISSSQNQKRSQNNSISY